MLLVLSGRHGSVHHMEKGRQMGTVLITGASSGIGADLARQFHAAGPQVILVARRRDRLENLAAELGASVRVLVADLADRAAPARIFAETGPVDILVNNAGFGDFGDFSRQEQRRQQDMIAVNISALTALTQLYLPSMVERRTGRILNVASIVAFLPCPGIAVYAATKAYVLSFSDALAAELRGSGVTVTCLCPGSTETEFADIANMRGKLAMRMAMASTEVARIGAAATLAGTRLVVTGLGNRINSVMVRLVPRGWLLAGVRKLFLGR